MSKKIIVVLIVIVLMILGLFIFSEIEYKKNFSSKKTERSVVQESKSKKIKPKKGEKEAERKEEKVESSRKKSKIQALDQMPLEELKRKGAKKEKEEFDLTPSVDDLIRMKKERIKAY